jgi:hypothetical protein
VETIIDQRPSAVAGDVGYWFYGVTPRIEQIRRTGTWAALGGSTDAIPRTATFTTIWLDHGIAPLNAQAAYAIVPKATAASMRRYVPPTIIVNDSAASAVRFGNSIGIVFWQPGTVAGIRSDAPAIVYVTATDLYAADPTNGTGTFNVTVDGQTIAVPRDGGRTFRAALKPARRRAIR